MDFSEFKYFFGGFLSALGICGAFCYSFIMPPDSLKRWVLDPRPRDEKLSLVFDSQIASAALTQCLREKSETEEIILRRNNINTETVEQQNCEQNFSTSEKDRPYWNDQGNYFPVDLKDGSVATIFDGRAKVKVKKIWRKDSCEITIAPEIRTIILNSGESSNLPFCLGWLSVKLDAVNSPILSSSECSLVFSPSKQP